MRLTILFLSSILFFQLTGCGNGEEAEPEEEASYEVKGRYLSTSVDETSISVIHETIPDVMDAMRMSLRIDDLSEVEDLETGDHIEFDMVHTQQGWFIRNIEKLPEGTEPDLPEELQDVGLNGDDPEETDMGP